MIKVCGMTDAANIREIEALGVDFIGFIFHKPSPRYCGEVPAYLPSCRRVGVFVDATLDYILEMDRQFAFDYIQLHGSESPEMCLQLTGFGKKVIKAFRVKDASDIEHAAYYDMCKFLLFDTRTELAGGSGKSFDWSILEAYHGSTRFFLSGGIGPDSPAALKAFSHPYLAGYDLNSRFETSPGIKDPALVQAFMEEMKKK